MKIFIGKLYYNPSVRGGVLDFSYERSDKDFETHENYCDFVCWDGWISERYPIDSIKVIKSYGTYSAWYATRSMLSHKEKIDIKLTLYSAIRDFIIKEREETILRCDDGLNTLDRLIGS